MKYQTTGMLQLACEHFKDGQSVLIVAHNMPYARELFLKAVGMLGDFKEVTYQDNKVLSTGCRIDFTSVYAVRMFKSNKYNYVYVDNGVRDYWPNYTFLTTIKPVFHWQNELQVRID